MFVGFNVDMSEGCFKELDRYYDMGKKLFESQKDEITNDLEKYIRNDILDGTLMQEDWFPTIHSNIFLSHSHLDEDEVIALSGCLYEEFGLKSFIDSSVWGYSNDLLKILDDSYSIVKKDDDGTTYNYNQTIITSSHVHMMLSMALAKMIDKTECLFFLSTPNSINIKEKINEKDKTLSPWIYAELQMSEIIRKKKLEEYRQPSAFLEHGDQKLFANKDINVTYDVSTKHLYELNGYEFCIWKNSHKKGTEALDQLYKNKKIIE